MKNFSFFHAYHRADLVDDNWHEIGIGNWFRFGVCAEGGWLIILIKVWGKRIFHFNRTWGIDA